VAEGTARAWKAKPHNIRTAKTVVRMYFIGATPFFRRLPPAKAADRDCVSFLIQHAPSGRIMVAVGGIGSGAEEAARGIPPTPHEKVENNLRRKT
jgi:hypothetical protein